MPPLFGREDPAGRKEEKRKGQGDAVTNVRFCEALLHALETPLTIRDPSSCRINAT